MLHGMWKKLMVLMLCISLCCTGTATCLAEATEEPVETNITASDYSDENNWLAIPEITKEVDTFYIYPTAYLDPAEGAPDVCDIDSEILRSGATAVYEQQATAYEAATNVFAPFYRQVNLFKAASATPEERVALLQGAPKTDMYAALDYYFEKLNGGRPFILAGHSQGAQLMTYVLSEYMSEHPEYYERMVAAYALGYSVTDKYLEENPHLKFAEGEEDLGVVISWNTEGEGNADAESFVIEAGAIAINPLNWKRDETYAGKEACLGARIQNVETGEYEVFPAAADAQLNTKRGVVVTHTDVLAPMDVALGFGPDSYHGGDYSLWYTNIQENAKKRVDAWVAKAEDQALSPAAKANALLDQEEYEAAISILQEAAANGDAEAQYTLGNCYYGGKGVEQNYEEAAKNYKLAADQGFAWAQGNLGYCYFTGAGVEQDYDEAMRLYRLAADQGDEVAIFNIGYAYYVGKGAEQDYDEALKYYRQSAELGLPVAMFAIADCYFMGNGVEQDPEEAASWYRKALAEGYTPDENDQAHLKEALGEDYAAMEEAA